MLACLDRFGSMGAQRVARAQVVVEELVVNALTYGGDPPDAWAEITLAVCADEQQLELVLRDPFRAFDPFASVGVIRDQVRASSSTPERVGLGRLLAADLPSERSWHRDGAFNEVRLVFR